MDREAAQKQIVEILKGKKRFLLLTHKDPDPDGIGSMLALGKALSNAGKEVCLLTKQPLHSPLDLMPGSQRIVQQSVFEEEPGTIVALDCGDINRIGGSENCIRGKYFMVNIDHHESHDFFGHVNLVDPKSSSTGEMIYRVIKSAGFSFDPEIAANIFTAIQADTGSFRYSNTTAASLKIAGEMIDHGADANKTFLMMNSETSVGRMRLMEMAMGAVEFHCNGRVGMVVLTSEMFNQAQASWEDSERFVDYLRYLSGVELAVLIREVEDQKYKVSMRSNNTLNVAGLANLFGGGGHAKAAGFECHRSIEPFKKDFLLEAGKILSGVSN